MKVKTEIEYDEPILKFPILTGSFFDLGNFDFSFKDILILDVQSEAFKKYILNFQPFKRDKTPLDIIEWLEERLTNQYEKYYAIVKSNPNVDFKYKDIEDVWKILLIIYPSDLQIEHEIEYNSENSGPSIVSWNRKFIGDYPGNPLHEMGDVSIVNNFIALVFNRLHKHDYIQFMIDNYISSYEISHLQFQFLNLCICLEALVGTNAEITYKISRSTAVLCGENEFNSQLIFNNVKKLYKLRSALIHGNFREKIHCKNHLEEYLPYLRALTSRILVELLVHDIPREEIIDTLNRIGFGERNRISVNWKKSDFNLMNMSLSNWTELTK